jgi:hypothetical protein
MNRADAISAADLAGGEPEPTDVCIDCGATIPVGFLRCTPCDEYHEFADDPREAPTGVLVPRR